jgi:hypothetical protein
MKTWEMTQEFGLEGKGRLFLGEAAEPRTWCNSVLKDTAPAAAHIPDGPNGIGGSALSNEYLSATWYELQVLLNSGNHQHHNRWPVDWVYLVSQFHDLYIESHNPEPVRLLVAVTKALQSTDARIGPGNYSEGWRPEQNIDPNHDQPLLGTDLQGISFGDKACYCRGSSGRLDGENSEVSNGRIFAVTHDSARLQDKLIYRRFRWKGVGVGKTIPRRGRLR